MSGDNIHTIPLAESSMTIPSDSEQYSGNDNDDLSPSPPSSSASPMILYSPPTIWGLLRGAAINLFLPFINGLMLGFGELFAHEAAFRLGWGGTKVSKFHSYHLCKLLEAVVALLAFNCSGGRPKNDCSSSATKSARLTAIYSGFPKHQKRTLSWTWYRGTR